VQSDPSLLARLIRNLLANAVRYTDIPTDTTRSSAQLEPGPGSARCRWTGVRGAVMPLRDRAPRAADEPAP
jgi:hypothetical protein